MRAKTAADGSPNVRFLDDALAAAGVGGAHTLCPITDPYVVHHAALGSLAWVHLDDLDAARPRARRAGGLPGVEGVLDRVAAADGFELPADRIGDLVVLADEHTVLGKSRAAHDLSALNGHAALARRAARARRCRSSSASRSSARARSPAASCTTATSTTCCSTTGHERRVPGMRSRRPCA